MACKIGPVGAQGRIACEFRPYDVVLAAYGHGVLHVLKAREGHRRVLRVVAFVVHSHPQPSYPRVVSPDGVHVRDVPSATQVVTLVVKDEDASWVDPVGNRDAEDGRHWWCAQSWKVLELPEAVVPH